jgi:pSer/pThr/pTyr-binding forkhead associated (FHA) protein
LRFERAFAAYDEDMMDDVPLDETMSVSSPLPEPDGPPAQLSVQEEAAVDALPPGTALLIVLHGPNVGARFLLDQDVTTAGRSVSSDIFLDDVTVSREHARFERRDGGLWVADAGSLNGTYVNRERVVSKRLESGDEVQIGKYRLTFYPSSS